MNCLTSAIALALALATSTAQASWKPDLALNTCMPGLREFGMPKGVTTTELRKCLQAWRIANDKDFRSAQPGNNSDDSKKWVQEYCTNLLFLIRSDGTPPSAVAGGRDYRTSFFRRLAEA